MRKRLTKLFSGRLNRKQFAIGYIGAILVFVAVIMSLAHIQKVFGYHIAFDFLMYALFVPFLANAIILQVRRLHDQNMGGVELSLIWVVLVAGNYFDVSDIQALRSIGTVISVVFIYLFFFKKGTEGVNKYGDVKDYSSVKNALLNIKT